MQADQLHAGAETSPLAVGSLARVAPHVKRRIVPGPDGVVLLALGGTPGKPYEPRG